MRKGHLAATLLAATGPVAVPAQQPAEPLPSTIRFNQVGFTPDGPKRFVVATAAAQRLPWRLVRTDGIVAASGRSEPFGPDSASGERVHRVVVTARLAPGTYRLVVAGVSSRPVVVSDRPFRGLFRNAMSFFYQQRAGEPIRADLVQRQDLARAAGHAAEVVGCFTGVDRTGMRWPGCSYQLDVTGGWYDAGDHGKYVVNGGISTWALLNTYERGVRRSPRAAALADGALRLPERGNGVPDLLDEARVEVAFLLSMQVPEGARTPVLRGRRIETIAAGGLVHHKVSDIRWTPLPTAPADDREPRALFPPSTAATLNLAAVAAHCARVWRTIDLPFARRCLAAATRAWAAAEREPALIFDDRFEGSGGYGDADLSDERFWAAAELYATTGDPAYRQALLRSPLFSAAATREIGWADVSTAGTITLLTVPNRLSSRELAGQRRALLTTANADLARIDRGAYGVPYGPTRYPWGSNGAMLNVATVMGVAYDLTGRAAYREGIVDTLDYMLGRNPLDRSFVTGFGARPMRHPHHRFWAQQANPRYPAPPPGVLSGGPNDTTMTDEIARTMKGRCRPQRCWRDDYRAFTQNEVAINWNAPLVWIASFLDGTEVNNSERRLVAPNTAAIPERS